MSLPRWPAPPARAATSLPGMLAGLVPALLDRLLPGCCALCGQRCATLVCGGCQQDAVTARPRCRCCANPFGSGAAAPAPSFCGACLAKPPAFDATFAGADYAAPLDQLLLQLKFAACLPLAPWFAQLIVEQLLASRHGGPGGASVLPELIAPVPLGRQRLAERGFNQALEVARPLARMLGVPLAARLATRLRETAPQSALAPAARAANVRAVFSVDPALVRGRHVGVVDDVMTSGRTLDALARELKQAGATRVSNFVVARTPPK